MTTLSVAIPCYEMHGKGTYYLENSFKILYQQTYEDFDVVIADHSIDGKVLDLCSKWQKKLDIKYFPNPFDRGSPAANTNFAIENSTGKWIKILCQDDFLYDEQALTNTMNSVHSCSWLASSYVHTEDGVNYFKHHVPSWNDRIYNNNTIGTPSCVTVPNVKSLPKMDARLGYAYDCDWYKMLYDLYGLPVICTTVTVVNYLHKDSITSHITQQIINKEFTYIRRKYEKTTYNK